MSDTPKAKPKNPPFHYAWLIAIGCCFMNAGGLGAVLDAAGVFFVPVCDDLGFLRGDLQLYLTFYFIATIVAMPIIGWVLPKYNIRIVLSVAMAITALGVAAMGTYNEVWQWYVSGVVFGLAGSFIFVVPAPILIINWFKKRTGVVLGIVMMFSGIGGAVLAPVFTYLIELLGWRNSYFLAAVIIALLVLPWTLFVFRFRPSDMGLRPYGWTEQDEQTKDVHERKGTTPSVSGVPFKKAVFSVGFVCMFLFCGLAAYYAGFNSNLPGFAVSIGYSPMFGAGMLSAVMIGNMFDKLVMGYLNDKVGVRLTVFVQLVMIVIGFLGFLFFQASEAGLLVAAFFFGVQNSLFSISTPLMIRRLFGEKDYARIFTWARIGTGVIGAFGPPTVGYIYDFTGTYNYAFLVGIAVAVLAAVVMVIAEMSRRRLVWEE
ncbi:MAG: MFS transporter [Coriobacteriales bacterium]|jgi:MFS family permease|nr:MFS transporter [Coriobacteriales bacterium]